MTVRSGDAGSPRLGGADAFGGAVLPLRSGGAARRGDAGSPRLGGAEAFGGAIVPLRSGGAGSARLGAADGFEEGALEASTRHRSG